MIEVEDYVATKEYIMMLQTAANKLDQKITDVINIVNNEIYPGENFPFSSSSIIRE